MANKLTPKMEEALVIAVARGSVTVGGNFLKDKFLGCVYPTTILSLIKNGYLSHCYNTDGGLAVRLTDKGFLYIRTTKVDPNE